MQTRTHWLEPLKKFTESTEPSRTFLSLDLDGTALLEDHGKVFISSSVEKAVKAIHDLNIPLVLNTLRFPLSVINTVGHAWYEIADAPILTVLLNGSVLGYIKSDDDHLHYEEIAAYPLTPAELASTVESLTQLEKAGVDDLLVFFYSRDWQEGETLWTPKAERVPELKEKFVSASRVLSGTVEQLRGELFPR